jgi:CoA:oxalate CoA-transferase
VDGIGVVTGLSEQKKGYLLAGLRVVEIGDLVAVPFVGKILSMLGADVIKVEPPEGDIGRRIPPFAGADQASAFFWLMNNGKRSVAIRRDCSSGVRLLHTVIEKADVVLSDLVYADANRLRLSPEHVAHAEGAPCVVSITPFGVHGPGRNARGSDLVGWASSGSMSWTGEPGRPPIEGGNCQALHAAALYGLVGVIVGLLRRRATGVGCHLDVSIQEACVGLQPEPVVRATYESSDFPPSGWRIPGFFGVGLHTTRDGYPVLSGQLAETRMWRGLQELLGKPDWMEDTRLEDPGFRERNADEIQDQVRGYFESHSLEVILEEWWQAGLPIAPVATMKYLESFAQLDAREFWVEVRPPWKQANGAVKVPGLPFKSSAAEEPRLGGTPALGRDTRTVLLESGIEEGELSELGDDGIIGE